MAELTLESLAARVAELERRLAELHRPMPRTSAEHGAAARVAELTDIPSLADNPFKDEFLRAMRENRERMAREDAERMAAEDASARQAG